MNRPYLSAEELFDKISSWLQEHPWNGGKSWRQNVDRDSPFFSVSAKFTLNGCTDTGSVRLAGEGKEDGGWGGED